jgi:hypothetical protein
MSWTQPMCDACWISSRGSDERPVRMHTDYREPEQCAWCGRLTSSGIYVRIDPATMPYPTIEE